jgi:hypothetical protein
MLLPVTFSIWFRSGGFGCRWPSSERRELLDESVAGIRQFAERCADIFRNLSRDGIGSPGARCFSISLDRRLPVTFAARGRSLRHVTPPGRRLSCFIVATGERKADARYRIPAAACGSARFLVIGRLEIGGRVK